MALKVATPVTHWAIALALAVLLACPSPSIALSGDGLRKAEDSPKLLLECGAFDPLSSPPPIPDDLKVDDSDGYFIVQLAGPVLQEWREELEALGVVVFRYLPEYAFIVRMTPLQRLLVSALDFVRWVGPFHPGYRISPRFAGESGELTMSVLFLERAEELEARIRAMGVDIISRDRFAIRVRADVGMARCLAFLPGVEWVEPFHGATLLNNNAARIIGARQANDGPFLNDGTSLWSYNAGSFEGVTGKDVIVAVADTGVDGNHVDFSNKKVWFRSYFGGADWTDSQGHGTHVSGSVLGTGAGQGGRYAGMAPEAMLIGLQAISGTIANEAANAQTLKDAQDHGADICTNSWGDPTAHGTYGAMAIAYDTAVRDCDPSEPGNQSMIVLFGAGNEAFTGIREPATAKNVITVGATGNNVGLDPDQIASFSSNGPTNDGRRKPDVMAPGLQVTSCAAGTVNGYRAADGTSMSTPITAGAAALVVQYYRDKFNHTPSPALMKALLANGAQPMAPQYPYPGNGQGWGRINITRTLLSGPSYEIFWEDETVPLRTTEEQLYNVNVVSSSSPFKVMLAWTDPPGAPAAEKKLVNDLDLVVLSPTGATYYGNNFTGGQSVPGGSPDDRNNLEGFYLKAPSPGTWVVKVRAKNVPSGPQDYAIVVSGDISVSPDFVDLMVVSGPELSTDEPVEGDEILFNATIRNNGTLPAIGAHYRIMVNNILISNVTVPEIPENTSLQVSARWIATRGKYLVRLELDPLNLIRERNETNNSASVNIEVLYRSLMVITSAERRDVDPGAPAVFYLDVKNAGTANDSYSLELTGPGPPPGWNETLNATALTLRRSSSASVNLTVRPPANATVGENHTTQVVVRSLTNSSLSQTLNLTTVVRQVFGMEFNMSSPAENWVEGGQEFCASFSLRNPGNGRDFYTLSWRPVGRSPGWPVNLSAGELVLGAREEASVSLRVDVPREAFANDSMVVEVTATSSQGERQSHRIRISVLQIFGTELSIFGITDRVEPGRTLNYTLTLINTGNGNDTVFLKTSGPPGWFLTLQRSAVLLPPRGEATVELSVTCPAGHLSGQYRVNVTATGSGGNVAVLEHNITVNQNYKVSLNALQKGAAVYGGEAANFTLLVGNLGNGNDTIELSSVELIYDWSVAFDMPNVTLAPGEFAEVNVTVLTSNLTPEGNYTVKFRAVSTGRSVVQNQTAVTVEILKLPEPPPPPPPPPPQPPVTPIETGGGIPVWLIILIFVVVAAAGAGAVYARIRKRRVSGPVSGAVEEPPAEALPLEAEPAPQPEEARTAGAEIYLAGGWGEVSPRYDQTPSEQRAVEASPPYPEDLQHPPGPLYLRVEEERQEPEAPEGSEAPTGPRYLPPDWQPEPTPEPARVPSPEEAHSPAPGPQPTASAPGAESELEQLLRRLQELKKQN